MMTRYACLMMVVFVCLNPCFGGADETIRDIRELKQDHRAYLDIGATDTFMMDPQEQQRRDREYNDRHFSPWHGNRPQSSLDDIIVEFDKYEQNRGYGRSGRKYGAGWIRRLRDNAGLQDYSHGGYAAITLRRSSLRALPTEDPHFKSRAQAVSGHPFDNLQATAVMVNTPVFISHTSRDGKWVWAETGYYFGWMRAQDVAALPGDFLKRWETGRYAVIVRDKTPLYDAQGRFVFRVSLGTFFPLAGEGDGTLEILIAVEQNSRAALKKVVVPKDAAAAKPVPMTTAQMARMANELILEPYGWGGLNGHRDCSAMLRDLFAPFGIWLPRNSTEQALEGGTFIDLSGLSAEAKENRIVAEGVPYLTLLWRKGHIMLYIGRHDGRPLVFHNLWGISTRLLPDQRGKLIVGHAAVTTLHPGRELPDYHKASADLSANILGMTLLGGHVESLPPQGR